MQKAKEMIPPQAEEEIVQSNAPTQSKQITSF